MAGLAYVGLRDPSASSGFVPCPFKAITGLDCPFCGSTRALHSLLNGDIGAALSHNVVTISAIAALAIFFVVQRLTKRQPLTISNSTWIVIGVGLLVFTVARNLPIAPFDWLNATA